MSWRRYHIKFLIWRKQHITDTRFLILLSAIVGFLVGIAAVIIKNFVHVVSSLLENVAINVGAFMYIFFPIIGIALVYFFINFLLKKHVGHGIPSVLYAISKDKGQIAGHNLYSSIISSVLTVSFGGSVGLEGPTVATGAAVGSNVGKFLHLNYKQITLLLGAACSAAMAAIFKAPIAAIVFALEVIMLDLTLSAIVPLLVASVIAVLTSYFFMGQNVLYAIEIQEKFTMTQVPYYIILGFTTGIISVYFYRVYTFIVKLFDKIKFKLYRLLIGGTLLGFLIFLMPSLFGEGYETINQTLSGDISHLFKESIFNSFSDNGMIILILLTALILLKVVATSLTFGSGGVGGIFAPSLFIGSHVGLLFVFVFGLFDVELNLINYTSVAMAGMIAGVIYAPLTAIFLIAEITGGYELFVPLMIVSTISFATTRIFTANSVYTAQLARRGQLLTHHKDQAVLTLLKIKEVIDTDLVTIQPGSKLKDLIPVISGSDRNIFPVVDKDNTLLGIISLEGRFRQDIFKAENHEKLIDEYIFQPKEVAQISDSMETVMKKFTTSSYYNMPVIDNGKYVGFVSRSNTLGAYRKTLLDITMD
jgi:CIC family chloride channel protein